MVMQTEAAKQASTGPCSCGDDRRERQGGRYYSGQLWAAHFGPFANFGAFGVLVTEPSNPNRPIAMVLPQDASSANIDEDMMTLAEEIASGPSAAGKVMAEARCLDLRACFTHGVPLPRWMYGVRLEMICDHDGQTYSANEEPSVYLSDLREITVEATAKGPERSQGVYCEGMLWAASSPLCTSDFSPFYVLVTEPGDKDRPIALIRETDQGGSPVDFPALVRAGVLVACEPANAAALDNSDFAAIDLRPYGPRVPYPGWLWGLGLQQIIDQDGSVEDGPYVYSRPRCCSMRDLTERRA